MIKLTIEEIKKRLREWRDFYGADIPDTKAIDAIKTLEDARKILEAHRTLMYETLSDANAHLDSFEEELEL